MDRQSEMSQPQPVVDDKGPRLSIIPPTLDVGEQTIGSDEWFTLAIPFVRDRSQVPGLGIATVAPAHTEPEMVRPPPDFRTAIEPAPPAAAVEFFGPMRPLLFVPGITPTPLQVRFSPRRAGEQEAVMTFAARWQDDVEETHTIALHGRARNRGDVPLAGNLIDRDEPRKVGPPGDPSGPGAHTAKENPEAEAALTAAAHSARTYAKGFARSQRDGFELAEMEAKAYQRQPPEGPWWEKLAETAILMGVAGVAGAFAGKAISGLLGKLANRAIDDKDKLVQFLGYAAKEGLKDAAKAAIAGSAGKPAHAPAPPTRETAPLSTNPVLAFFARQQDILTQAETSYDVLVDDQERRLREHPFADAYVASDAMEALRDTFDQVRGDARAAQTTATAMQWIAGIAQTELRVDTLPDGRTVTDGFAPTWHPDGLLEIDAHTTIQTDHHAEVDASAVHVTGARIQGISQEIADRLRTLDLAHQPIPINVIVHGPGYTIHVRRDEAGRVSSCDAAVGLANQPPTFGDRTAAEIVRIVVGTTLADWGVANVGSDDATGRGGAQ